jgi:hypothetical protein
MLLECRVDDKTVIYIDAEASAGLDKGGGGADFVPDKAIDNILRTTAGMAKRLSDLLGQETFVVSPPSRLAIDFGVRVDSLAAVSVSKTPEECQFRISLEWNLAR